MSAQTKLKYISVEEYLEGEQLSDIRHEYIAGQVFAMVGTTLAHNVINLNLAAALHSHLRGTPCTVVVTDMKVRVRAADAFYYPDLAVFCNAESRDTLFLEQPRLIIEVLSPSTAQVDQREKRLAYQKLDSLQEYVLVAQKQPQVEIYRRTEPSGWELLSFGADDVLELRSVDLTLPMGDVYAGVDEQFR